MAVTEYQRGYAAGLNAKHKPHRQQEAAKNESNRIVLNALAERAERAERGAGIGKCDECLHWQRKSPGYHWGTCKLTDGFIAANNWPWRGEPKQEIVTQENFGCIRFQPMEART